MSETTIVVATDAYHRPVMIDEVLEALAPVPAGIIVDATLGGGGHAAAMLEARPDCALVGIDRDAEALDAAQARLAAFSGRVAFRQGRYDGIADLARDAQADLPAGDIVFVLFDLGVSSHQLDSASRGFSYRHDGPLDMRMHQGEGRTAADVVNSYPEKELASVLRRYADERFAGRIARAIVARRPVTTTGELAEIVRSAIPAAARRTGGHPATRAFQALRIEVNDELAVLERAVPAALGLLAAGGRCAAIAYHSGEDRIVKHEFRTAAGLRGPRLPIEVEPPFSLVRRGGITPSASEIVENARASAARLRVIERARASGEEIR